MHIYKLFSAVILTYSFTANAFENDLDSLVALLDQNGLGISEKAEIYVSIGNIYDTREDYERAVRYLNLALENYRQTDRFDEMAHVLNVLGKNHSLSGDDIKSLVCFREVLSIANKLSAKSAIGDAFHNIGIVYEYESKPDSSFFYYKRALEEREILGDTSKIASSLRAMGEILRGMGRMDEALEYCLRALSLKDHIEDKKVLANIYNETGYLYELQGKLDTALVYYQYMTDLCREIGLKRGEAIGLANTAVIYERMEQFDKTLDYHFKALEIDLELSYSYGIMKDYFLIAITYKLLRKYNIALSYLQKSDSLCRAKWSLDHQEIQELYYQIYKESGDFEKAMTHYETFTEIKDSISSKEVKTKIARLYTEYETAKKEQEIQYLNAENKLKDQKLKLRSVFMISLIIIFIMAMFLTLLIIRQKSLRIQNMNIELRNFLLEVDELKMALSNKQQWHTNQVNNLLDKYDITVREADVLHLISLGYSNIEIAEKLFISINTVKYHIRNLYLKLDAKNRIEIINKFSGNLQEIS